MCSSFKNDINFLYSLQTILFSQNGSFYGENIDAIMSTKDSHLVKYFSMFTVNIQIESFCSFSFHLRYYFHTIKSFKKFSKISNMWPNSFNITWEPFQVETLSNLYEISTKFSDKITLVIQSFFSLVSQSAEDYHLATN